MAYSFDDAVFMNFTTKQLTIDYSNAEPLDAADPRAALIRSILAASNVAAELSTATAANSTPCSEWKALDVARHMIAVIDRAAAGAKGQPLTDMPELVDVELDAVNGAFTQATREFHAAWADDVSLTAMMDVPWGTFPGAAVLAVYTADLLVHVWDLAAAIDCSLNWPEDDVVASLAMAKVGFPDESRDALPFEHSVAPEPNAPTIERLAAWTGRDVSHWRLAR